MAVVIDATVGGASANSFALLAEADAYHSTVLHADAPWPDDVSASATIGAGVSGVVTVTVDATGVAGNLHTAAVVAGVGANQPMTAAIVGSAITVTLGTTAGGAADPAKNTAVLVAAAIEALTGISAVASGTGVTVIPVTATKQFAGGLAYADTKARALIMATQWLVSLIHWTGYETSLTQALPWPRKAMWARHLRAYVLDSIIPTELKHAEFELARLLIASDRTAESDVVAQGIASLRAGPVSLEFRAGVVPLVLPDVALRLLVPSWIDYVVGQSTGMRELLRA